MAKGPAEACKELHKYVKCDATPARAVDILVQVCIGMQWHTNTNDAREDAEKWEKRFLYNVASAIAEADKIGEVLTYAFNSSSPDMIQGCAYVEPGDAADVVLAKGALQRRSLYIDAFKGLTPTEFEALCAGVLAELGVSSARKTPESRDEGIDFYGRLSLEVMLRGGQKAFPGPERQFSVWMVGQAKHFKDTDVSTMDVRELVGSMILARTRTFSTRPERYSDLTIRTCDPVFCIFITTGEFSRDARVLMSKAGIIAMDGSMVAAFLSDRDIGIENGIFDEQELKDWITTSGTLAD